MKEIIISNVVGAVGKWTGGFGNKRTSGDHQNYSIIGIGQNTKSPGHLRRLAVSQSPVKKTIE